MSLKTTLSRSAIVTLFTSALLAAGSCGAYVRWRPLPIAPDPEISRLVCEIEALRENTDQSLEHWRKLYEDLKPSVWTNDAVGQFAKSLGDKWQWEWPNPGSAVLRRSDLPMEQWADFITLVDSLAGRPGLRLDALEIRASGARQTRRITDVRLVLRFQMQETPAPSSASSRPDPSGSPAATSPETKPNKDPQ